MEEAMDLPAGFRFHPTDEELISHYLILKAVDNTFSAVAIGEADLNKCEPWDLPKVAKMGEKEWYFFCVKDRKYPTGMRTNRATKSGYWKATGKDKEIFRGKSLVGMKKTLVFYKGRAPRGHKSNWVMHEYRLDGQTSLEKLPSNSKNEWVICRVFDKSAAAKKNPLTGFITTTSFDNELITPGNLPPLMESSPTQPPHVSCFSNPRDPSGAETSLIYANEPPPDGFISHHSLPSIEAGNYEHNYLSSEHQILRAILENQGAESKQSLKTEDNNADISSVVSNFYMGLRPFDYPDGLWTGGSMDVDAFLNLH